MFRSVAGNRVPLRGVFPLLLIAALPALWACSDSGAGPGLDPVVRTCPGDAAADPTRERVAGGSPLQDKNYYLLTLFRAVPEIAATLEQDPRLREISRRHDDRLRLAAESCGTNPECHAQALRFSMEEIEETGEELARLAGLPALGCALVEDHLRPSGAFQLHAGEPDAELLRKAWQDTAAGLGIAFDAFALSLGPAELDLVVAGVRDADPGPMLFFEPLLEVVLAAMAAQGRDEAGRYEPLEGGENRAALERMLQTRWEAYPYPAMLVPGQSPEIEGIPLSPLGRFRCDLAAERFSAGLTPFIVLSGGHVHPDRTPFSEAIEMKRYLMAERGVPESALLVDPHARHTTTNLRNFARLLFRYGLPTDRFALVTTDPFQALYIVLALDDRCERELGYIPYTERRQTSLFDLELLPDIRSLRLDPRDPLDP